MMKKIQMAKKVRKNTKLVKDYGYFLAQLLHNRGISKVKDAERFLHPRWEDRYNPFSMLDMEKGVERFYEAIKDGERIVIYSDYDADGIPGAIILSDLLKKIGYTNYEIYIPHRHREGYGLHRKAIESLISSGVKLIITIDLGITAFEEASLAREKGVDLIISDHHLPKQEKGKEIIPDAFAVINPKREGDHYGDSMICGAGVIFKFVEAFLQKYRDEFSVPEGWEKWLLDMLGIATLSDMVPLKNENRIFAHFGMRVLREVMGRRGRREGLKALLLESGIHPEYMTEEDIVFGVTPRINAASRMSHANDAIELFRASSLAESTFLASELTGLNNTRKKLVQDILKEAKAILSERDVNNILVIGKKEWPAGILGLVASKLLEEYHIPVFVWGKEGEKIKGSIRSPQSIHLIELLDLGKLPDTFQYGGHAAAGGFSCNEEDILSLEKLVSDAFIEYEKNHQVDEAPYFVDMELSVDDISLDNYRKIRSLAPFGVGNEKPLFLFSSVVIEKVSEFGKEKNHLEIYIRNSAGKRIRAIAFFKTKKTFPLLREGNTYDILAHMEYSVFRGKHELRLRLVDILQKESIL